jgi:hypothetical protein
LGVLPREPGHSTALKAASTKNDDLFRDGMGQPPGNESQAAGSAHGGRAGLSALVRTLILIVGLAAAAVVLYGMFQVFVCDFREVVFKGMSHRAVWLCR